MTTPTLRWLDETDSTNDEARRRAWNGAPNGTAVAARRQRAGRGRSGRRWEALAGDHVALSVIYRPTLAPERVSGLTLDIATAVASVLTRRGFDVGLKWPNDVLLGGLKVGGVLCELHTDGADGPVVIVGLGLNVDDAELPASIAHTATTLSRVGGEPIDRDALVEALAGAIVAACAAYDDRGAPDVAGWSRWDATSGRRARWSGGQGRVLGLAADGGLRVQPDGATSALTLRAGEVTLLADDGP